MTTVDSPERRLRGVCTGCEANEMTDDEIRAAEDRSLARLSPEQRAQAEALMGELDTPYHELAMACHVRALREAHAAWVADGRPESAIHSDIERLIEVMSR